MSVLVPIAVLLLLLIAAAPVVAEMRAGSIAGWPKRKGPMVSTDVWPDHNLPGLSALAPEGEPAVVGGIDRQSSKNWMVGNVRPISRQEFFASPREMVAALRSKAEDLRRGFVRDE